MFSLIRNNDKAFIFLLFGTAVLVGLLICILNYKELVGILLIAILSFFLLRPLYFLYIIIMLLPLRFFIMGSSFISNTVFDTSALINISIPLWTAYYLLMRRKRIFVDNVMKFYFVFIIFCIISLSYATNLIDSLKYLCRILTPLCIYIICANEIKNRREVDNMLAAILWSCLIPLSIGLFQSIKPSQVFSSVQYSGYNRIFGTFVHPNPYSFFLFVVFIISWCGFLTAILNKDKICLGALSILTLVSIALTYCRITWIAVITCILFTALFFKKRFYLIILMLLIVLLFSHSFLSISDRISDVTKYFKSGNTFQSDNSIGWRFQAWRAIAVELRQRLFFGYGLRAHFNVLQSLYGVYTSVHNTYLEILYDLGIFAFIIFLYVLSSLFMAVKKTFAAYGSKVVTYNKYISIFCCTFIGYSLFMFSDNMLEYYDVSIYYWIIFSIGNKIVEVMT